MIPFNVKRIKSLITFWGNKPSICFLSSILLERSKDLKPVFLFIFQKLFLKESMQPKLVLIFLFNTSSPVRCSYLSIFPDNIPHIFADSLSISYCRFPSPVLSSIILNTFERFCLKRKGLSDVRVAPITKKEYGFAGHFYKDS